MNKLYLTFFLLFYSFVGVAQEDRLAQLKAQLEQAPNDSVRATVYIDLHNEVFKTNVDLAKTYAAAIVKYGSLARSWKLVETGYQGLARCEQKNKNYNAVFEYNFKALEFARKTLNEGEVYNCLIKIARDYIDNDRLDQSVPYLDEAEQLAVRSKLSTPLAKAKQSRGYYYAKKENHKMAVSLYEEAIALSGAPKDAYLLATTRMWMGRSLLYLRKFENVPPELFKALAYFTSVNSLASKAACYEILGECYLTSGDAVRGIASYVSARQLYELSQNKVQQGLVDIGLASCYILAKDFDKAQMYLTEADGIFKGSTYLAGVAQLKTCWATYYSELGKFKVADSYFAESDALLQKMSNPALSINNEGYWAAHAYRKNNQRQGDSLTYSYARRSVALKSPVALLQELNSLKSKNQGIDSISMVNLKLLYTKNGVEKLKEKYPNKSLKEIIPFIDSLYMNSMYSNATAKQDSISSAKFHGELSELETKYRTKIKADSLIIVQQKVDGAIKEIRYKNIILVVVVLTIIILTFSIISVNKAKKQAIRDEKIIRDLKKDLEHRTDNYLRIIRGIINKVMKGKDIPELQIISTRIGAVSSVYEMLKDKSDNDPVNMQVYLSKIVESLKQMFDLDDKVKVYVDAEANIPGKTAVAIGLIANEIITNSLKHAFPNQNSAIIRVNLNSIGKEKFQLNIYDNGKGFDHDKVTKNTGLPLLKRLANQVRGELSFESNQGTAVLLSFNKLQKHEL